MISVALSIFDNEIIYSKTSRLTSDLHHICWHTCTCYVYLLRIESRRDSATAVKHIIPESLSISKIRPVFRHVRCWWCLYTCIGQVSVVAIDWMLKEGNKRRLVRQLLNMHVHVHNIPCSEIVLVWIEKTIILLFSWIFGGDGGRGTGDGGGDFVVKDFVDIHTVVFWS